MGLRDVGRCEGTEEEKSWVCHQDLHRPLGVEAEGGGVITGVLLQSYYNWWVGIGGQG